MSKRNISAQDKIVAVKRYLDGLTSQRILANEFGMQIPLQLNAYSAIS